MISVNSTVKLNFPKIQQLTKAQVMALEQTAEALHTNVVQAQVFPRDTLRAVREKSVSFPVRHTQDAFIFTRNIISRRRRIRMQEVNGMRTGFLGRNQSTAKRHTNKYTGGLPDYDVIGCTRLCGIP